MVNERSNPKRQSGIVNNGKAIGLGCWVLPTGAIDGQASGYHLEYGCDIDTRRGTRYAK